LNGEDVSEEVAPLIGDDLQHQRMESLCWALFSVHRKKPELEKKILRQLMNNVVEEGERAHLRNPSTTSHNFSLYLLGHDNRCLGIFLEVLIKTQSKSHLIPKLVKELLASRNNRGIWYNTMENCFSMIALNSFFRVYEKTTPNYTCQKWLGDIYVGSTTSQGRDTEVKSVKIPMSVVASNDSQKDLFIEKKGEGRMYYRIALSYAPSNLQLDDLDRGFKITRSYSGVDSEEDVKKSDDKYIFRLGALIKVNINIQNKSPRYHVAIVDNLPAGIEALNQALKNTESVPAKKARLSHNDGFYAQHKNIRDDRVEAFTSYLYPGERNWTFFVRATSAGDFVAPPAKAEEMYSPEVFGRTCTDKITIQ